MSVFAQNNITEHLIDGSLEAITSGQGSDSLLVCCHPHPLYGGSMNNKVITTAATSASRLKIDSIRFNFRGVGKSNGSWGQGEGECDDLRLVLNFVEPYAHRQIILLGFSFGSNIASRIAQEYNSVCSLVVAPSIDSMSYPNSFPMPISVLQPLADEVVDVTASKRWYDQITTEKEWIEFADTSHFFHGQLLKLREIYTEIFSRYD